MADNRDSMASGLLESLGEEEFRRSVYVQVRRSMPLGILENVVDEWIASR